MNACAAIAAAAAAGVDPAKAVEALGTFAGVRRRLELIHDANDIKVYDDFAHHPTAIRLTLEGLRRKHSSARLLVALEPRSNTMKAGVHVNELGPALAPADRAWLFASEGINWDPHEALAPLEGRGRVVTKTSEMLAQLLDSVKPGDRVVFMSNGGFESAPRRFCEALAAATED
jgi:UDP-N-acetylmuramate: L-alanyl-gamma-D-glutamyl-meso-diaminopimelate ligase